MPIENYEGDRIVLAAVGSGTSPPPLGVGLATGLSALPVGVAVAVSVGPTLLVGVALVGSGDDGAALVGAIVGEFVPVGATPATQAPPWQVP